MRIKIQPAIKGGGINEQTDNVNRDNFIPGFNYSSSIRRSPCVNPVQSGPGCPNDVKTSNSGSCSTNTDFCAQPQGHHTIPYITGFKIGEQDKSIGSGVYPADACQSSDYTGTDLSHCEIGYTDGYSR
jgi:hypothetical protein